MADAPTSASLAAAGGTFVLTVASFAAISSASRHWNVDRPDPR